MKSRLALTAVAFALVGLVSAMAADAGGKWTAQVPGRGGNMQDTTFNFKVDGDNLTGTVTGGQAGEVAIKDGKVSGDDISFNVAMSFGGNDVKIVYKGKVKGDEIAFTRQREGSDRVAEFTAKRAK
jgi:hypothetical protein